MLGTLWAHLVNGTSWAVRQVQLATGARLSTNSRVAITLGAVVWFAVGGIIWAFVIPHSVPATASPASPVSSAPALTVASNATTPLHNNCSGGYVTFTFDGGPKLASQDGDTPLVLGTLLKLHLKAVFFVIGQAVATEPTLMREELRDGMSVQNHTWDHADWTGQSAHTHPLTVPQVHRELLRTVQAIVAAGGPRPYLYRPPFDDVTQADNQAARSLGERIVLSYGDARSKIIDSEDWMHIPASQIAHQIIHGYYNPQHNWVPGIRSGSILGYHDGVPGNPPVNAAYSLQPIVNYMNAHHLCSTTQVHHHAGGGVFQAGGGF